MLSAQFTPLKPAQFYVHPGPALPCMQMSKAKDASNMKEWTCSSLQPGFLQTVHLFKLDSVRSLNAALPQPNFSLSLPKKWVCMHTHTDPEMNTYIRLQLHKWKWKLLSHVRLFVMPWTWNSPGQSTGVGSLLLFQTIFPTQGLNLGLPHCRWILYQLNHKGSPGIWNW